MIDRTRTRGLRRLRSALLLVGLLVGGLAGAARAQSGDPLFTYVQLSDSQPDTADEWARYEQVLDRVVAGGSAGALIPRPVDFVLFAGDLVSHASSQSEWIQWVDTINAKLTANGIPYRAIPGNHDQDGFGVGYYELYVGSSAVWESDSAVIVGHNGLTASTGWSGLRFIGFNNSNGAWNQISASDLSLIASKVSAAATAGDNVVLVCHHPHDGQGVIPLANVLPNPTITGYSRGHSGSPGASKGLDGISNPNVWDLNSNSIVDDSGILYYEVFESQIKVYVITGATTTLPTAKVIGLPHALRAATTAAPVAGFSATPTSGPAPLAVNFSDTSTNNPTAWLWSFGDGATSTARDPSHSYATPGVYDVSLTASNAGGSNTLTRSAYVSVLPPPPSQTFTPTADARVNSSNPDSNYGSDTVLRIRAGDPSYKTYLRFAVSGVGSASVLSAKLRLYATDSSNSGGSVYPVSGSWTENGITWNTAPALTGAPLATAGSILANAWVEHDVSAAVTGDGTYAFGVVSPSTNSGYFSSREGANPPQLVVQTSAATAPVANFALTPSSGVAPLAVAFTDLSSGGPTSWLWTFGDGQSSTAQNPVHSYASAGSYDVRLTATNALGSNSLLRSAAVTVSAPVVPTADFSATPLSGAAPLAVAFTDLSAGSPTSWLWQFGDGATSNARNPSHTYTAPGTYDVRLTATNGAGSNTKLRAGYVSVAPGVPTQTFVPAADARVASDKPTSNYGSDATLRVRGGSTSHLSYLRFETSALGSASVVSAKLRLYVSDASSSGGSVYAVSAAWTENAITWNTAPALPATPLATAGAAALGQWVEFDVTPSVRAGSLAFAVASSVTDSVYYASRETSNPPQLVVETGAAMAPIAEFSATPTLGPAPLAVAFSDLSQGGPTAWLWSFGDGTTSTAQNPTHTYAAQGIYTVSLTATSSMGSDVETKTGYLSVQAPLPITTYTASADAKVNSAKPTTLYGTTPDLRLRLSPSGEWRSFLRFDVADLTKPVVRATLRLYVTESSVDGGSLYAVPEASVVESTLSWSNAPALDGTPLATLGGVSTGQWVERDVTSVVTGNGSYAFGLRSSSSDSAYFSSRQGANPPQLVIEWAP